MRVRKWRQHANSLLKVHCGNVCETHSTLPMLPHVPLRTTSVLPQGQPDPGAPPVCAPEIRGCAKVVDKVTIYLAC